MAKIPSFAANPRSVDFGTVSAANTNRDGTGTIVSIATGSTAGFKINSIVVKHTVTTTAGMIRLYLSVDGGTTWVLFDEIEVAAITPSASVSSHRAVRNYNDLVLMGTSMKLGASTHAAESCKVYALGADL